MQACDRRSRDGQCRSVPRAVHGHGYAGGFDQRLVAGAPAGANQTGLLSVSGFNLTPSAQATIEYTVVIASNAPDNTTVANVAVASDDQGDRVQDDANVVVSVPAPPISVTTTPTPPSTTTTPTPTTEVVQTPVTGVDPVLAVWLAIAGAIVVSVVGYAAFVTFKVLR
ncbi:MAG: hypothetical protein U0514_03895 [Candidatus Andersenbacteria bacterium]